MRRRHRRLPPEVAARAARKVSAVGHYDAEDGKLVVIVSNLSRHRLQSAVVDVRARASGRLVQRQRIEVEPLPPGHSIRRLRADAAFVEPVDVEARIARVVW